MPNRKNKKISKRRPESMIEKVGHGFLSDLFYKQMSVKFCDKDPYQMGEEIRREDMNRLGIKSNQSKIGEVKYLVTTSDSRFHWNEWLFDESTKKTFLCPNIFKQYNANNVKIVQSIIDSFPDNCLEISDGAIFATNEFFKCGLNTPSFKPVQFKHIHSDSLGREKSTKKIAMRQGNFIKSIVFLNFVNRFFSWINEPEKWEENLSKFFDDKCQRFLMDQIKSDRSILDYAMNKSGTKQFKKRREAVKNIQRKISMCETLMRDGFNFNIDAEKYIRQNPSFSEEKKNQIRNWEGDYTYIIDVLRESCKLSDSECLFMLTAPSPSIIIRSNGQAKNIINCETKLMVKLFDEFLSIFVDDDFIVLPSNKSKDDFKDHLEHLSESVGSIPIWEKTGRRIIHVSNDVVSPFLKTNPPCEHFTVEQPKWGKCAYFQFEWPEDQKINASKIKNGTDCITASEYGLLQRKNPANKISEIKVDGALIFYDPDGEYISFENPCDEARANDFFESFNYDKMLQNNEITSEEYRKEKQKTLINYGGKLKNGATYNVSFFATLLDENKEKYNVIQQLTLFSGIEIDYTTFNSDWGKDLNRTLLSLVMNILYALNRTKIIEMKDVPGKRAKSFGKLKNVVKWKERPYTTLSMDTHFKQIIRKSYQKIDSCGDATIRRLKPHVRDPYWGKVWVLGDNLQSWEIPDAQRSHPKSGNTLYRVSRWHQGSYINGNELDMPKRKSRDHIKKWKPIKSKEIA